MAEERAVYTQGELSELLREDPKFALNLIDSVYREHISRFIRSRCRYFDEDDIGTVYIETMKSFVRCVKKPDYDYNQEPLALIYSIAKLRSLDQRRAKKTPAERSFDDLLEPIVRDMKDTRTRLDWMEMREDWPEFRIELDKLIDKLPDKQRDAMNAFVESYWEIRTQGAMAKLAEQIRKQYGYHCNAANAADNVRAAIETLAPQLTRAGFNLLKGD